MFWNKKNTNNNLGVPLSDLELMLKPTSIKTKLKGNTLTAQHEHYTTRIEVLPPDNQTSGDEPIRAVVRVVTELPEPFVALIQGQEADATAAYNSFAALGALYTDQGNVYIGSRLTIYDVEDAWSTLHLPLLMITAISGAEATLGALRRTLTNEGHRGGASEWSEHDFAQVANLLSRGCVCTTSGLGLTAEFGLGGGEVSAARGDHHTALFTMTADQPHPELGGGLFCLLQMPHQLDDVQQLKKLCLQLNSMEMAARDLPPHFGAWCPGKSGNNPAYVSFLPNPLHEVTGIASNTAAWAMSRARWANAQLKSIRV